MASNETLILRAALDGERSVYRDIEIEPSKSLYKLAEAIVAAFGFDFDHAFGFYSGLKPATMMRALPQYELFADMGDARPGVGGVKKTKIAQAFPEIGHTMMFLFDYGDDWHFRVSLKAKAQSWRRSGTRAWLRHAAMLLRNIRTPTTSTMTIGRATASIR
jgi:hypothetical protein